MALKIRASMGKKPFFRGEKKRQRVQHNNIYNIKLTFKRGDIHLQIFISPAHMPSSLDRFLVSFNQWAGVLSLFGLDFIIFVYVFGGESFFPPSLYLFFSPILMSPLSENKIN
ncbi:hypothetical protein L6164_029935 [Bauhinia variegata]|uniref:Uncharacterized protein n=1 Tax=Bauhinia variegata TaxID=167791 RepID=A0ACB9LAV1_BAUVA|nr:hypothetical protein L6164_029935 [Bauhinia variegata]